MKRYGYQKTWTMRAVKTHHRITFSRHTNAAELREFLSKVPDDATFHDYDFGEDDDGDCYIEFFHEEPLP